MTISDLFNDIGFIFVTPSSGTPIWHRFENRGIHAKSVYELAVKSTGIPERDLILNNQITENFFGNYYGYRFFLDTDPNSGDKITLTGTELEITKYLINPGINGKTVVNKPLNINGQSVVKINRITNYTIVLLECFPSTAIFAISPFGQDGGMFMQGDRILFKQNRNQENAPFFVTFENTNAPSLNNNIKLRGTDNQFVLDDINGFSIEFFFDLMNGNPHGSSWVETLRNSS